MSPEKSIAEAQRVQAVADARREEIDRVQGELITASIRRLAQSRALLERTAGFRPAVYPPRKPAGRVR